MPTDRIRVTQKEGILSYDPPHFNGMVGARLPGIEAMVGSVVNKHNIQEDFEFYVRIADDPWSEEMPDNYYGFCVYDNKYEKAFPDYMYVGQPETGLDSYTRTITTYVDTVPQFNKVGWVGSLSCGEKTNRPLFKRMAEQSEHLEFIDVTLNTWVEDAHKLNTQFMSYQDQVDRWKYLIDLEGCGWSGRLKLLMASPRITFIADRPYSEWWFQHIEPWKHYVPVKRDLSDLIENYHIIEGDMELQNTIKKNAKELIDVCLTRESAENRIYQILQHVIKNPL